MTMMEFRLKYTFLLIPLSAMLLALTKYRLLDIENENAVKYGPFRDLLPAFFQNEPYNCVHSYTIELLSIDPLVIYLNDFISDVEVKHLLNLGPDYVPSPLSHGSGPFLNQMFRQSQTAYLPEDDVVCKCLVQRMKRLLGNVQHKEVERLQIVKYRPQDHFKLHTDWFEVPRDDYDESSRSVRQKNRLATIFAYLDDNCTHGETYFPSLPALSAEADRDKFAISEDGDGLLVKPRRGNAIFWNNLHVNGTGDERVVHAGLPVESGTKVGLNMWSHYFHDKPMVGE